MKMYQNSVFISRTKSELKLSYLKCNRTSNISTLALTKQQC